MLLTGLNAQATIGMARAAAALCNPLTTGAAVVNTVVDGAGDLMCPVSSAGRQAMDSLNYTVGNVDSCNTAADGSYNISCDEVIQADENAFNSSFDYTHDANDASFVNCTPINAPDLLERMQLQDMAKFTADNLTCNLAFVDSYMANPGSQEGVQLESRVKESFATILGDLKRQLDINADASATAGLYQTVCTNAGGDGGRNLSSFCTSDEHFRRRIASQETVKKSDVLVDAMIATVPYGSEPKIKQLIKDLAARPGITPDVFVRQFREKMKEVQSVLQGASDELKDTIVKVPLDGGGTTDTYLSSNSCKSAGVEARYFNSPQYDELLDAKNLSPRLRSIMKCRRERRGIGSDRVQAGLMAASVLSAAVTGGASLAGLAISGAARVALVAADLSLLAVDSTMVVNQIYEGCYQKDSAIPRVGQQCRPLDGLNLALNRTSNADCALNVIVTAIPGAFAGGSAIARRINGEEIVVMGRARSSAARTAEKEEARVAAETRAAFDAEEARRTAARTRQPGVSEAPGAGRARTRPRKPAASAAPEIRSSVADAGAVRSVPNDSPSLAFARASKDDEAIRMTSRQETELANESYARKEEMDSLLTADGAMDKFAVNRELNEFLDRDDLDGFFRKHGSFPPEKQRRIRELAAQITEERIVLTRSKVNNDLDELTENGLAEVKTQKNCDGINALNSTTAFHTKARCSVITFKKDVENYCSCGSRGGLGSWAGPCAEMAADYLLADTLADRDALPEDSARGLQECKRLKIPAGTVVVHGGLKPTMSGHGGAAQIFIPSRGLAPRGDDASRLLSQRDNLSALGISEDQIRNAPTIEVVAVAPLNPNPEVTALFNMGRECRQTAAGCSPAQLRDIASSFERFKKRNPTRLTDDEIDQFTQWSDWLRGCRSISLTRATNTTPGSSFSAINASVPGCSK